MQSDKNDFLQILKERGFIHQCTDEQGLATAMKTPATAYIGFDCTAPSLHVGSLMQIMVLRWLQKCGHRPLVLMGGATTRLGDPTGKDAERPPLSDETIASNMKGIQTVFGKFINFDGENAASMLNNADWTDTLGYLDMLREYGSHFSINRMLSMDSVKLRLERESEMSFLEFNYMILQAYDFVTLYRNHGCRLQIGGSDQWGNIISGVELHRRLMAKKNQGQINTYEAIFGLTTKLITTASGTKMGKTESGAVWLNADMCSPYDYWQFWRNTEDGDVERFLKFFTELSLEDIAALMADKSGAGINHAKKVLANEATTLCHGRHAAEEAAETARKTFEEGGLGGALPELTLTENDLGSEASDIREIMIKLGFAESKGDAKKLIAGGGVKLNDQAVTDAGRKLALSDFENGEAKLSKGKKHHARLLLAQ